MVLNHYYCAVVISIIALRVVYNHTYILLLYSHIIGNSVGKDRASQTLLTPLLLS